MPVFSLTPQQLRALETLMWLHDESDENRRSGRSTVIAINYLQIMVSNYRKGDERWVTVRDHNHELSIFLVDAIERLAEGAGISGIERRQTVQMRISPLQTLPPSVWEAVTQFHSHQARLPESTETKTAPLTLWDHLIE